MMSKHDELKFSWVLTSSAG